MDLLWDFFQSDNYGNLLYLVSAIRIYNFQYFDFFPYKGKSFAAAKDREK
jgi:hypothetical protein